ncbi:unnamed protein product [Absidia cylindrospora]
MKDCDHDQVDKKRQKNPLAFFFRHKPYFLCGGNYKSEVPFMIKGIFGAPLECAAQCGTLTPYGLSVPDPVNCCFTEILARGLRVEGLFRLSGAAMEVEQLQEQFDQPPTYGKYLDLTKNDIHAITSLVKKYLRHLPDPVIPIAYHQQFLQLQVDWKHGDRDLVFEWARMIKNEFPTTHYHVMHYIILVVSWIQHYQHLNLMNPEALAVVLAPICSGLEKNISTGSGNKISSGLRGGGGNQYYYQQQPLQQHLLESVDQIVAENLKWTNVWTLLIQHHDILLDYWRPTDSNGGNYHYTAADLGARGRSGLGANPIFWQRHSVPSSSIESGVDTPLPWTQSTMTVPEEDMMMGSVNNDDDDDDDDEDDNGVQRTITGRPIGASPLLPPTAATPASSGSDERYGVIVMRKQQNYRRRHLPGVAKDDEHIYLYDTPLPPLPIPELHSRHTTTNDNADGDTDNTLADGTTSGYSSNSNNKTITSSGNNRSNSKNKKKRFILRRPKSIASLQPRVKTSSLF